MSKHTRSNLLIMNRWSVWIMSICRPKQQRALSISLSSSSIANFICHFSLNFHRFPFILISFCFYRRICNKQKGKSGTFILSYLCHFKWGKTPNIGYLDQGLLVRDAAKLRKHYFSTKGWRLDILSVLPTDFLYFWWEPSKCHIKVPCPVIVRLNRLFRLPRMLEWFERTETATGYPNAFRICKVSFNQMLENKLQFIIFRFISWWKCSIFLYFRNIFSCRRLFCVQSK